MKALDKLTKARIELVLDHPFFAHLALRLALIEDRSVDTAYTDGVVLGYHPDFIDTLSPSQTRWLIAHEVMHLACLHHTRKGARRADAWNLAADYAINAILEKTGFKAPAGCLKDTRYDGLSAEAIYDRLSVLDNHPFQLGPGQVRDAPAGVKQAEAQWQVNLAQAAQQARAAGALPQALHRLVQSVLVPQVDWRTLLRQFVEQAAKNDYSWLPPSRRYLSQGVYLPGLRSKQLGDLVIALDTSGSIDTRALDQFAAEISCIVETYDTVLQVVYCDSRIQGSQVFGPLDLPLAFKPTGGGGTDFRPVFDWVEKQHFIPCALLYLTDLACSRYPDHAPDYPVLWVQTGAGRNTVPFGQILCMR